MMDVTPGEIRLLCMGDTQGDDSLQLKDSRGAKAAPLTGPASFNAIKVRENVALVPNMPEEVRQLVATTAPSALMSGNASLMRMLLYLLDLPAGVHGVHREAYQVLSRLPTFEAATPDLKQAAGCDAKGKWPPALRCALCLPETPGVHVAQKRPGALLYALEALYAQMRPAVQSGGNTGALADCA